MGYFNWNKTLQEKAQAHTSATLPWQLLIDQGQFKAAKELLLSIPFQKVHQTYTRTNLWDQLCEKLHDPCLPIPASLGEDRLATFGAYREFEK